MQDAQILLEHDVALKIVAFREPHEAIKELGVRQVSTGVIVERLEKLLSLESEWQLR